MNTFPPRRSITGVLQEGLNHLPNHSTSTFSTSSDEDTDCEAQVTHTNQVTHTHQDHAVNKKLATPPVKSIATCTAEKNKNERQCLPDDSPISLQPDLEVEQSGKRRKMYWSLAIALVLAAMIVGVSVGVVGGSRSSKTTGTDTALQPPGDSESCDTQLSQIETECRQDSDKMFEINDLPKCIHDDFVTVLVRSKDPHYNFTDFRTQARERIASCSPHGLALKRLSAMEYEKQTTGELSCEYVLFTRYYELGEIEWWTEEGAEISNACAQEKVQCLDGQVEAFWDFLGDRCYLSDISFLQ
eukprot:CAMPEP_0194027742 /NCGR_PEP_ID=MMETSP0009_2-20130614/1826_1 /TAXON_ID=210454 /ORGANISM="Grammatophora oceanica, Strain CCMP 410" /LENGTH=299 /DNA_ID=CAMNT_0038666903 /DNA_START=109 /DNA_END=1008 /DNA_ORIENTATION=-